MVVLLSHCWSCKDSLKSNILTLEETGTSLDCYGHQKKPSKKKGLLWTRKMNVQIWGIPSGTDISYFREDTIYDPPSMNQSVINHHSSFPSTAGISQGNSFTLKNRAWRRVSLPYSYSLNISYWVKSHSTDGRVCRNFYHILQGFSLWHIEIIKGGFIFWWGVQHVFWLSLEFCL